MPVTEEPPPVGDEFPSPGVVVLVLLLLVAWSVEAKKSKSSVNGGEEKKEEGEVESLPSMLSSMSNVLGFMKTLLFMLCC